MNNIEFTDRYAALGIPCPDPETICLGQCEGTGWYPENDKNDPAWISAHKEGHSLKSVLKVAWKYKDIKWLWQGFECDGWHFIKCPDCDGKGTR